MRRLISILLFLNFFLVPCFPEHEKEVHVKKIRGEYTITTDMDISPKAAALKALEEAKHKALVKVCGERVNSWDMVESGVGGESFNSVNMVQVDGEIVEYDVIDSGYVTNPARTKEMTFYYVINATVKKGLDPDPDFTASFKGIRGSYIVDDTGMSFTVLSSKDAFLKVFIFENEEVGTILYPNEFESAYKLQANQEYTFPNKKNNYYELYTDKEIETDIMVFVLTKTERPFLKTETSRKEIEAWLARIPNNEKFVHYTSINIVKK